MKFLIPLTILSFLAISFAETKIFKPDLETFHKKIKPIIKSKCLGCHGPKRQQGDFRIDELDPDIVNGTNDERWHEILNLVILEDMPPPDEADEFLEDEEFEKFEKWVRQELDKRKKKEVGKAKPVLRRLTRDEYANTLKDLLGVDIDLRHLLPPEALSKDGFTNNGKTLVISPLHIEYFLKIASTMLDKAIVTSSTPPKTYRYRWDFETNLDRKYIDKNLGFQSVPMPYSHMKFSYFKAKPNEVQSETFKSNLNLDEILHAGFRGSKKDRYWWGANYITLQPIVPNKEVGPNPWQGPSPNIKIYMQRDFPLQGKFRVNVEAKPLTNGKKNIDKELAISSVTKMNTPKFKYDKKKKIISFPEETIIQKIHTPNKPFNFTIKVPKTGLYQVDLKTQTHNKGEGRGRIIYDKHILKIRKKVRKGKGNIGNIGVLKLKKGNNKITIDGKHVEYLAFTPLAKNSNLDKYIKASRVIKKDLPPPYLRAFLGNRQDDGMQYKTLPYSTPINKNKKFAQYTFTGRLENFPLPIKKNDHLDPDFLSGTLIVGLWNDIFSSKENPAIAIKSIAFEAPIYDEWPPRSHKAIFIDSDSKKNESLYARKILKNFLTKAFRRTPKIDEVNRYFNFWSDIRQNSKNFEQSIKKTLVPVLVSTSFLYRPEPALDEDNITKNVFLDEFELASRLSYFLWASMPDERLLKLARTNQLRKNLDSEIKRLLKNPKSKRFTSTFATQWLDLEKGASKKINTERFGHFNRFVKEDFQKETKAFVNKILTENLDIRNFIKSDFTMANQNLTQFYKLKNKVWGPQMQMVKFHKEDKRGGLLTQGSFLSGHSTGEDSHPIKRGVWLAKKLLDNPPPKPPPNVPEIPLEDPEDVKRPVKEQLKRHRDSASCRSCHRNIDPWGIIFEAYDTTGSLRSKIYRFLPDKSDGFGKIVKGKKITIPVDSKTQTPDGQATIDGVEEAQKYILENMLEDFTTSVVKHLLTYAIGRSLSYKDEDIVKNIVKNLEKNNYKSYYLIEGIIKSKLFLHK